MGDAAVLGRTEDPDRDIRRPLLPPALQKRGEDTDAGRTGGHGQEIPSTHEFLYRWPGAQLASLVRRPLTRDSLSFRRSL